MAEEDFQSFVDITRRLRKECPWDKVQTHESIRHSLIEEAYEVVETIDHGNFQELKGELGDILLHVVFHSNIAEEEGEFVLADVIRGITEKLIRRHPHIFGTAIVRDAAEVKKTWERLKMEEGRKSMMDGVPKELPGLLRAHRLTDKASKVGFDWKTGDDAWKMVEEEIRELRETLGPESADAREEEFGDLLFALVNYSRFIGVNPENAIRRSIEKFIFRFRYIEEKLKEEGKDIHASTLEEMDAHWNAAKEKR